MSNTATYDLSDAKMVPISTIEVGDRLVSYSGTVATIRDTAKRRYFTIKRDDGMPTDTEWHESNAINVFAIRANKP